MKRRKLISCGGSAIIIVSVIIYICVPSEESRDLQRRSHQAKDVMYACMAYASAHAGRMPNDLESLGEYYGKENPLLAKVDAELELVVPGISTTNEPDTILLRERKPDRMGRRIICYLNGACQVVGHDGMPIQRQPQETSMQ